jgi:hypothetical protein
MLMIWQKKWYRGKNLGERLRIAYPQAYVPICHGRHSTLTAGRRCAAASRNAGWPWDTIFGEAKTKKKKRRQQDSNLRRTSHKRTYRYAMEGIRLWPPGGAVQQPAGMQDGRGTQYLVKPKKTKSVDSRIRTCAGQAQQISSLSP